MEGKKKKTKKIGIIVGSVLLALMAVGLIVKINLKPPQEESPKLREYVVTRGDITAGVEGGGKILLQQESYSFEEDVVIGEVHVKEGQSVKQGDSLVSISEKWLENKKKELNENLKKAQTDLKEKQNEKSLKKKMDGDTQDKSNQLEYEKFDQAIGLLKKDVTTATDALANHQKLVDAPTLSANSDGVVLSLPGAGGEKDAVVSKKTTIITVGDTSKKQVQVLIPQEEIAKVNVDQNVNITVDAFEERSYTGKIVELNLKPQEQENLIFYSAIVSLDPTTDMLLEGMTAYAEIILKEKKDVLILSNKAIGMKDGKQFVKVKQKDNTLKKIELVTGFSDGKSSEIVSGLNDGDIVVIEG